MTQDKVVVIGGGPVGALSALYAARRGYQVDVYELRDDLFGGSAPLSAISLILVTLSERGFRAIEGAGVPGLTQDFLKHSISVHSRKIHRRDSVGKLTETAVPYSPNGECLHIIQRTNIGVRLLLALSKQPNVKIFSGHRLVHCDLDAKTATFEVTRSQRPLDGSNIEATEEVKANKSYLEDTADKKTTTFDFIIGADGAHSPLRQHLMRQSNMNYQQEYVDVLWCDFSMPPAADGSPKLDPTSLHVWPNKDCMFLGFPDIEGSSRGGLVAPRAEFRRLQQHPEELETYFSHKYPGVVPNLMSAESAKEQFLHREHRSLVSIKCGRLGYGDSCVLLGDSSHTMVPFYGMGMNTGLEDVRIFFEDFIDPAHRTASHTAFCPTGLTQAYTEFRLPDVQAMTDIAAEHFNELKNGVHLKTDIPRKFVESKLHKYVPALDYKPFYSRIVFGHERLSVAKRKDRIQKILFNLLFSGLCFFGLLAMTFGKVR